MDTIVISYDKPATKELGQWLYHQHLDWRYSTKNYDIALTRNQAIQEFLAGDKQRLFMVNSDMIPLKSTKEILEAEGDLLYCQSIGNKGRHTHYGDGQFNAACCVISRKLLEQLDYPWFCLSEDKCDCRSFNDRAKALGYKSRMVGQVGHEQRCILIPHPSQPQSKWSIIWEVGDY